MVELDSTKLLLAIIAAVAIVIAIYLLMSFLKNLDNKTEGEKWVTENYDEIDALITDKLVSEDTNTNLLRVKHDKLIEDIEEISHRDAESDIVEKSEIRARIQDSQLLAKEIAAARRELQELHDK